MRGKFLRQSGETEADDPELSVAPLIDVSFLLLIFFLVSMTIQKAERDLDISMLPGGPGTVVIPTLIEVRAGGEIVLDPGPREWLISSDSYDHVLQVLRDQLGLVKALAPAPGPLIVIRADDEATQQRVIDVLNCLQAAGVERVSFQEG